LKRIGYTLQPMDIVLVNAHAGKMYGDLQYILPVVESAAPARDG
jgi:hypothetical protein